MRFLFFVLCCLMFAVPAFGFGKGVEGCSGDCMACHKLTKSEAVELFRNIDPTLTVEEVGTAPARGLFQVTLKKDGALHLIYLDFSKNYIVSGPIIDIKSKRNITQQGVEAATTINPASISVDNALVMGNHKGKRVLYLFSDPECPYCARLHKTVMEMVREDPQLKVYIILVPLDIHPNSQWKTESIVCTSKKDMGAALKMLENSYEGKEVPHLTCKNVSGAEMKKVGGKHGVNVTPTMSFANGKVLMGARGKDEIKRMIDQASHRE